MTKKDEVSKEMEEYHRLVKAINEVFFRVARAVTKKES